MKDITVVTTFHKAGLDLYAQRFLNSFADKVDKRIHLIAYAEECKPQNPDPEQITILDAKTTLFDLQDFKLRWGSVPKANGVCPFPEKRPKDSHKEFKWNAIRFANKVYAVFDACTRARDWCVWMDADQVVHSQWNYDDWYELLPDHAWITYVGRGKSSTTWPECGFYGLNLNHETCQKFLSEFRRYYDNAEQGIFTLEEWHDSYVFGYLLSEFRKRDSSVLDYSSGTLIQVAKTGGGGHPLINTDLGRWLDHLKGDRKQLGRSKPTDIRVQRTESYWQR